MNCQDFEELLSAYADGELSRTQREFIEEHLAGCADCRATLAKFEAVGRQLASLRETPASPDISKSTLSKIKAASPFGKPFGRWLRPVTAAAAIVAVIAILLVVQPWGIESPEAMAASIVRNSPEVQAALNGEEIEEVEVTTKVVDDEGNVVMMLVRTETRTVAAEVDLETKKVTEILHMHVPDFHPEDKQKAIDIASADSRVQELLTQGAIIGEVHLVHGLHTGTSIGPDGQVRQEAFAIKTASVDIELEGKQWSAAVNLDEGRVIGLGQSSGFPAVLAVIIVIAVLTFFIGVLMIFGLSFGNRLASKVAGPAAVGIGVITLACVLFCALLYLSKSMVWFLLLSAGTAIVGLVLGAIVIKRQLAGRKAAITGTVFCSLALVLIIAVVAYPALWNIITITVAIIIILVLAGFIVYIFYNQIKKIPRRWWRPALVAFTAVVVLVLAILQPWSGSLEPESVMAKAYTATEGLHSYRLTYSGIFTVEGETTSSLTEAVFAAPDRYHIRITNNGETDEFIIIGDTQYVTSGAFNRTAVVVLSDNSSSILSKEATLDLLNELAGLQTLPEETIDGVRCLHYLGKWDVEKRIEETKKNIQEFNADSDAHAVTDEQMEEIFEQMRSIDVTHEIWIGKDDYLIRQIKTEQRGPADENGQLSVSMTMNYYDFNRPITIEPPLDTEGNLLPGWRLDSGPSEEISFNCQTHSQVTGEDPLHRQIEAVVTVTNVAMGATANNVQVDLRNNEVTKDSGETPWINALPESPGPVNLESGQSETFQAIWEGDLSRIAGDKLDALLERTVIKITYSTPEGGEVTRMYTAGGAVYPSAVPPANPPGE
jgi:hypothetical protein